MISAAYSIELLFAYREISSFSENNGVAVIISVPAETSLGSEFARNTDGLFDLLLGDECDVDEKLSCLGLSFSLIVLDTRNGRVFLATGANSYLRLYFKRSNDRLEIRDCLPKIDSISEARNIINSGQLVKFIAGTWAAGPFEFCYEIESIRKDWFRVPSGHFVIIEPSNPMFSARPFDNIFNRFSVDSFTDREATSIFRDSVDKHIELLGKVGPVAVEFSGGIDSGVVFARSTKLLGSNFKGGITSNYPFFEFRREQPYREKILRYVKGCSTDVSHEEMLPFLRIPDVPSHDEPSVGSTSWGQFSAANRSASRLGASVLLTGHGGDVIFLISPSSKIKMVKSRPVPSWIPKKLIGQLTEASQDSIDYINRIVQPGFGGHWHPSMFEPGFLPRYASSESPSVRYTSGLVSREILRAAASFWFRSPKMHEYIQKPLGYLAFGDNLPKDVWTRPGKVNHLGNVYRGAKISGMNILELARKYSSVFELIDVLPKRFIEFTKGVIEGRDSGNQIFSQFLSVLIWLNSHFLSCPLHEPRYLSLRFVFHSNTAGKLCSSERHVV